MSDETKLQLAGRVRESIVDGPGIRYVVFTQGCPHACPGCHNRHTWPPEGGEPVEVQTLLEEISKDQLLRGVTLSGGEPFLHARPLIGLAREVRRMGLDVWLYSGYTWEEILQSDDPSWPALLQNVDVLVDGRYLEAQYNFSLRFRGSENQRLIDVAKSLETGEPVLWSPSASAGKGQIF